MSEINLKNTLAREQTKVGGVQVLLPPSDRPHPTQIPWTLFHAHMNGMVLHSSQFLLVMVRTALPGSHPVHD